MRQTDFITLNGKVEKIIGLTIESAGPEVFLGEVCVIKNLNGERIPVKSWGSKTTGSS